MFRVLIELFTERSVVISSWFSVAVHFDRSMVSKSFIKILLTSVDTLFCIYSSEYFCGGLWKNNSAIICQHFPLSYVTLIN